MSMISIVYRDNAEDRNKGYREIDLKNNLVSWHSDVSYEKQPPGTTWFWILDQPQVGGDTLFLSQVEAYNRLSPEFRKRLEGLTAVHSAVDQAEYSRKIGGPVRREPVESEVGSFDPLQETRADVNMCCSILWFACIQSQARRLFT